MRGQSVLARKIRERGSQAWCYNGPEKGVLKSKSVSTAGLSDKRGIGDFDKTIDGTKYAPTNKKEL